MKKIGIYCVNYHSYDSLNDYLISIEKAAETAYNTADVFVYVVDNTIPTEKIEYCPNNFSLQVFSTGNNLGYFGAVRYAMQQVSPSEFDYIIISNVDVLMTEDTIIELSRTVIDPTIGWIAPALYSDKYEFDWNPQAITRYPEIKLRTMSLFFKFPFLLFLKQKLLHQYKRSQYLSGGKIYAAHGSFIILTRYFFNKCGIIHYPIFLYYEEIYLAEECRKHQLDVVYMPQIHVRDIGKVSTGKMPAKAYCKHNYEGVNYILSHYY